MFTGEFPKSKREPESPGVEQKRIQRTNKDRGTNPSNGPRGDAFERDFRADTVVITDSNRDGRLHRP